MKLERTKNTIRSTIWGIGYQIVSIVLPFIGRTAFIYILGEDYLGLNSLFTSILSILNMSELGFSSAIVYSMYGAIARDDTDEICKLMNFYKKCYRIIGLLILFLGMLVIPILPKLITGQYPSDINIYVLYMINLFATASSYFLYAYKHSIFWAFQRGDLNRKILIPMDIGKYLVQILMLVILRNYYAYIIVVPIFNILTNILRGHLVDKYYPQYKARGKIDPNTQKEITKNVKALFFNKVGSTLTTSFDAVVISAYLGLSVLGKYNNYQYIMTSVIGFIQIIFDSLCAGWGNSLKTETRERNWNLFKEITFVNDWLICWCSACFMSLYQPFIQLWVGKNYLLPYSDVALITLYFWIWRYQIVLTTCKDAAGLWYADRFRPITVGFVNLGLNLLLIKPLGLAGVLLSSIISWILIGCPWLITNVFTTLFKNNPINFILNSFWNLVMTFVITTITFFLCNIIESVNWFSFVAKLMICLIVPNVLFVIFNFRKKEFKSFILRFKGLILYKK